MISRKSYRRKNSKARGNDKMSSCIHLTTQNSLTASAKPVVPEEIVQGHSPSITLATLCPHVPQNPLRTTPLPATSAEKSQMVTGAEQSGHQTLSRSSRFVSAGRVTQRFNASFEDVFAIKKSSAMVSIISSLTTILAQLAIPIFDVVFTSLSVSQKFHVVISL